MIRLTIAVPGHVRHDDLLEAGRKALEALGMDPAILVAVEPVEPDVPPGPEDFTFDPTEPRWQYLPCLETRGERGYEGTAWFCSMNCQHRASEMLDAKDKSRTHVPCREPIDRAPTGGGCAWCGRKLRPGP